MQINEQFSGRPLSEFEANVFSVEISNAAGSRFVNSTFFTIIVMDVMTLYYHLTVMHHCCSLLVYSLFCSNGHSFIINIYFNSLGSSIPIVITLVTMEESNKDLLMKVENEFNMLLQGFEMIAQTEAMTRFG